MKYELNKKILNLFILFMKKIDVVIMWTKKYILKELKMLYQIDMHKNFLI